MTRLLFISSVTALATAALVSSCGTKVRCNQNAQCGQGDVCLQVGTCANQCSTQNDCGAGEKCSASGGCVPQAGCGDDRDCSSGTLCSLGSCRAPCTPTNGCFEGSVCTSDGHCIEPLDPSGNPGPQGACGGEVFQSSKVQANFLIVLDHSGSMMSKVGGTPKWSSAVTALKSITTQYDDQVRFGLQLFSTQTKTCDPGKVDVAIGDRTATAIAAALPATANGNQTPIGGALSVAAMNPGLDDQSRANFVLLVTDGIENCNGDPAAQVSALAARGIKTYVVGFGNEVNANNLSQMAIAGGTARNTMPRYYQADSPTELTQAFSAIAQGAVGCDFKLAKTPPDPSQIVVTVNGKLVPHDKNRVAGWEYTASSNRVTLYGPACDVVVAQPGAQVSLAYGCPGTVVDAGYAFPTDAGDLIN